MKFLPALLLLVPLCASAQRGDFMLLKEKKWNLGVRIGFDASLPIVHSLSAGGEELQSSNHSYRVGYLAAIEAELTAVRTVMAGRLAGLAPEMITERLRETYV